MSSETLNMPEETASSNSEQLPSTSSLPKSNPVKNNKRKKIQRKWRKLNLRQIANQDEVNLNQVIYTSSYQYYSDESLNRIKKALNDDLKSYPQKSASPNSQFEIDDFVIAAFDDKTNFELFSKQQSLEYINKLIRKREEEKSKNLTTNVSCKDSYRLRNAQKRKQRVYSIDDGDNDNDNDLQCKIVKNNDTESTMPSSIDLTNQDEDSNYEESVSSEKPENENTKKSSRGRILKPVLSNNWLLDRDEFNQLDQLIGYNEKEIVDRSESCDKEFHLNSMRQLPQQYDHSDQNNRMLSNITANINYIKKNSVVLNKSSQAQSSTNNSQVKCQIVNYKLSQNESIKKPLSIPVIINGNKKMIMMASESTSKPQSLLKRDENLTISKLKTYSKDDSTHEGNKSNDENQPQNVHNDDKKNSVKEKFQNSQPVKIFSRFTPLGWKSYLSTQDNFKAYEINYVYTGEDRIIYIGGIINEKSKTSGLSKPMMSNGLNTESGMESNEKKPNKLDFSFCTAPFFSRLSHLDNEFKLYDLPTPLLVNMKHETNFNENRRENMVDKYLNILGKFYEKYNNRYEEKKEHFKQSRKKSILRRNIKSGVNECTLIEKSKNVKWVQVTAQVNSNGHTRLIKHGNIGKVIKSNSDLKTSKTSLPLIYQSSITTPASSMITKNPINSKISGTSKPLIYMVPSEQKLITTLEVKPVTTSIANIKSNSEEENTSTKRPLDENEILNNDRSPKKVKQDVEDDDIILLHEHIPKKNKISSLSTTWDQQVSNKPTMINQNTEGIDANGKSTDNENNSLTERRINFLLWYNMNKLPQSNLSSVVGAQSSNEKNYVDVDLD